MKNLLFYSLSLYSPWGKIHKEYNNHFALADIVLNITYNNAHSLYLGKSWVNVEYFTVLVSLHKLWSLFGFLQAILFQVRILVGFSTGGP